MTRTRSLPDPLSGEDVFDTASAAEQNDLMRSVVGHVIVERSGGRGVIRPLDERVRILEPGTPIVVAERTRGRAAGIVPIPLPNFDHPGVLRVPIGEDALDGAGGRRKVCAQAASG